MPTSSPARLDLPERVRRAMRDVPDFPKPGILFKDITPVLGDGGLFAEVIEAMAAPARPLGITHVAGVESRGFLLAAPIAVALGAGLVPIRKPGKLPWQVMRREYALEYGTDSLELHADACPAPARVLLVDDVLATGGTAAAAAALIEEGGGTVVACAFLSAIGALDGGRKLAGRTVSVLVTV